MKILSNYIIVFLSTFLLTACIEEYNPSGIDGIGGYIVVEGSITNDTTIINYLKVLVSQKTLRKRLL